MACRASGAKRDLVRVVRTPDRQVVVDPTGRLPGRGAYLCADGACWGVALRKGALSRALGVPLPEWLKTELDERSRTTGMMMVSEGGRSGEE